MKEMLDSMSAIYRSFLAQRYVKNSRGGGDWPDIKPETKRRRRAGTGGRRGGEKILIDTSTLQHAVSIQTGISAVPRFGPGGRNEVYLSRSAVVIGFSGASHPGKGTVEEIAEAHQQGAGYLPVREIIVEPDAATLRLMTRAAELILLEDEA